jgi:hypothetical protein
MKGQRCPYCQTENFDKNITWILKNCPVMSKEKYVTHVHTQHHIGKRVAQQQFTSRIPAHMESFTKKG